MLDHRKESLMRHPRSVVATAATVLATVGLASPAAGASATDANEVLEEIVVTATKHGSPPRDVAASVSVVEGEVLRNLQGNSLGDVLTGLPNVRMEGGPRANGELPQIRGLGGSRVIVLVDGARQSFLNARKGGIFLNPDLVKRVEVVRGPMSSLYGSGALGGVLTVETIRAADVLSPGKTLGGFATAGFESASDARVLTGGLAATVSGLDLMLAASDRQSEDLELSDGSALPFSGADSRDILLTAAWSPAGGHSLNAGYNRYRESGLSPILPDAPIGGSNVIADRDTRRDTARLRYRFRPEGSAAIDVTTVAYRNELEVIERRLDGQSEAERLSTIGLDIYNRARFATGALQHTLIVGAEYYQDEFRGTLNGGRKPAFPDGDGSAWGLYVQDEIAFGADGRYALIPGLRYDAYQLRGDAFSGRNEDSEVSAKLAARWRVTEALTLFGSWGEGFNKPLLQDIYRSGVHFPVRVSPPPPVFNFFVPNPSLRAERADTWEIGARHVLALAGSADTRISSEVVYFQTRANDFISLQVNPPPVNTTLLQNLDRVELDGLEASVRFDHPRVSANVAYGQVRGDVVSAGIPLRDVPGDTWTADVGLRVAPLDATLGWRLTYGEAQDRAPTLAETAASYVVNDVYLSWQPQVSWARRLDVRLRVNNLFDRQYQPAGHRIPEVGRDLRFSVSVQP
jgi:hemoglobin/transferrin/lactoferrin receptor protein